MDSVDTGMDPGRVLVDELCHQAKEHGYYSIVFTRREVEEFLWYFTGVLVGMYLARRG